jgi:hypothetical protein
MSSFYANCPVSMLRRMLHLTRRSVVGECWRPGIDAAFVGSQCRNIIGALSRTGIVAFTLVLISYSSASSAIADDPVYSGPQPGEKLPAFIARGVFDDDAGKDIDFIGQAGQDPVVLIFLHDVNRQSISMTRVLSQYTSERTEGKITTGVILLHDDVTEAESVLKRIRHALAPKAPVAISLDAKEGPGSYGLNRNVMLTILVGNKGVVTSNFALIQPSLQADLPKILEAVVAEAGGQIPRLEDLAGVGAMTRTNPNPNAPRTEETPNLRPLLAPVIRRDATEKEVEAAAAKVEDAADKDEGVRKEVGRIANTIIDAGKLADYGTPRCQEFLKKWAKAYGRPVRINPPDSKPDDKKATEPQPEDQPSPPAEDKE